MTTQDLVARARTWLAEDPDPDTREELAKLIEAEDLAELGARFARHPPVRHRGPAR